MGKREGGQGRFAAEKISGQSVKCEHDKMFLE